ncbi:hypothetical protein [Mycobacterium servetii]|uniref:DUF4398 domain-containing protein n=1 Tax=Mycobacterium servetii TaxID=3237418 RepID=A0ABV4C9G7_9MYCO
MADSPGDKAAQRAAELSRRERDLAAHRPVTEEDVKRAAHAHERAAEAHELAVEEGLGDVAAHRLAAEGEREAARRDLTTAQEADRQYPD